MHTLGSQLNQRRRARRSGVCFLALGLVLGCTTLSHAEDSLKGIFSEEEYRRAGLEKLSAEEQAALLRALHQRGIGKATSKVKAKPEASSPATAAAPAAPVEKKGLWARVKDFGAEQLPFKSEKDEGEVTEVEDQLTEPFSGLDGRTIFRLESGQVWQQRFNETYYAGKPIPNPKVVIMRTRFGYRLKIPEVGSGFDVAIKRIQ